MIGSRDYSGGALDGTYQYITERPELEKEVEDVVYATDPDPQGKETTENVPVPEESDEPDRPDVEGQSTLEDWGWSS